MTTHQRQDIRAAVKDRLVGKTDAAERVFTTREVPWKRVELPGLAIYALEETSTPAFGDTDPRVLERTLQLAVLGIVSLTEEIDDAIDALADQVEAAMRADPTFGLTGRVINSYLASTAIEVAEEQGRPIGAVRLTYTVIHHTSEA